MRVMAIDYGDARTGVAISDPAGLLAGYTTVIQSRRPELAAEEIAKLAAERQVDDCTGILPPCWRKRPGGPSACGTSGAPPLRPIRSSTPPGDGRKPTKRTWMPWRQASFWRVTSPGRVEAPDPPGRGDAAPRGVTFVTRQK